jgi:hypothetical protein
VGDLKRQVLARGELLQAEDRDLVGSLDLVVVGLVLEPQRKHTLLLQVGLVDSGKRLDDDGGTTQESGFKSLYEEGWRSGRVTLARGTGLKTYSMFSVQLKWYSGIEQAWSQGQRCSITLSRNDSYSPRRTFTVVVVSNNNPGNASVSVSGTDFGHTGVFASALVDDLVNVTLVRQSSDQHVLGDVLQVSSESQPRSSGRDVVSGTLADDLDEDGGVNNVLSVPSLERLQKLESVRLGVDGDLDGRSVLRRSLVGVLTGIVSLGGELETSRVGELELLAISALERVGQGVEGQGTGKGHGGNEIGGGNEGVGGGVGIVTTGKVSVVGSDDRVLLSLLDVLPVPLSDTGSTGVGQNDSTDVLEGLHESVTGNGSPDLLGTGGDGELGLGLQTVSLGLLGNGSRSRHVLVGRVGARSDKTDLELLGPVVVLDGLGELGNGGREIGSEGTVDVGLELRQVLQKSMEVVVSLMIPEMTRIRPSRLTKLMTWSYSAPLSACKLCWKALA